MNWTSLVHASRFPSLSNTTYSRSATPLLLNPEKFPIMILSVRSPSSSSEAVNPLRRSEAVYSQGTESLSFSLFITGASPPLFLFRTALAAEPAIVKTSKARTQSLMIFIRCEPRINIFYRRLSAFRFAADS